MTLSTRPPINDTNSTSGLVGLGPIPSQAPVTAFNLDQVKSLLLTKGAEAFHYKCALNPDRESLEMGVNVNTKAASKGVVFYEVRKVKAVAQHISLNASLQIQSFYETQSAQMVNVGGNYLDGNKEPVFLKPLDMIVLAGNETVMAQQLLEYNPNGSLRAKFPVVGVEVLFSKTIMFRDGVDFQVGVEDGLIHWLPGGRKPGFSNGKGEVLSLCSWIRPHWIVTSVPHSMRLIPSNSIGSGALPRELEYAPQQVVCTQSHLSDYAEGNAFDYFDLPVYVAPNSTPNTPRG